MSKPDPLLDWLEQQHRGWDATVLVLLGILAVGVVRPPVEISHDMAIDLDDVLMRTANEVGADLVVMASHVPGLAEYVFASRAGYLASHAKMSVLVVR